MLVTVGDTRKVVTFQQISAAHSERQSTQSIVEGPCTNIIEKPDVVKWLGDVLFLSLDDKLTPKYENVSHV